MVKGLGLPVERSVTLAAILIELPFMYVFMAVYAPLLLGFVLFILMAFLALSILMLADKRIVGITIMVKGRLLPVFRVMAFIAEAAKLLFMNILLLVAAQAVLGGLAVFALSMAFIAQRLFMFPAQLEFTVLCGMVVGCLFPALCCMAGITSLVLKLSLVRIFMTVTCIACLGIQRLITTLDMALFTFCVNMLAIQLEPLILLGGMIKERRLPTFSIVTRIARLILKLPFMLVFMAVGCIACLVVQRLVTPLDMALFTLCVYMLAIQLEPLILLGGMIKERRLPTLSVVTRVARLILKLIFVRVLVTEG